MQTKKITTPISKQVVELKEWITGNEYEEIMKPMSDIKVVVEAGGKEIVKRMAEINAGEADRKTREIATRIIVVSVDGETKDTAKKIGEMRKEDYLFVMVEIDGIYRGETFTSP